MTWTGELPLNAHDGASTERLDARGSRAIRTPEDLAAEVEHLFARPYNIFDFQAAARQAGVQIEQRHQELVNTLFAYAVGHPAEVVQIPDVAVAARISPRVMTRRYQETTRAVAEADPSLAELLPPTNLDRRVGRLIIDAIRGEYGQLSNDDIADLVRTAHSSIYSYRAWLKRHEDRNEQSN